MTALLFFDGHLIFPLLISAGITPTQLYKSTVGYLIHFVLPMRQAKDPSISPPLKISPQWALNTIRNVALYVTRVGVHPPLGPFQLTRLGNRRIEDSAEVIRLVEAFAESHCHDYLRVNNSHFVESGSQMIDKSCVTRSESSTEYLSIENTLFKDVRALPFHIDAFNILSMH